MNSKRHDVYGSSAPAEPVTPAHCGPPLSTALSFVLTKACLYDFPWLHLADSYPDRRQFERWAQQRTQADFEAIQRKELVTCTPMGPRGMWAHADVEFSRWWRPHRLDEVFVEAMYPFWNRASLAKLPYVIVVSSGPLGCYAVYLGTRLQHIVATPPQVWREDLANRNLSMGQPALERYVGATGRNAPNSRRKPSIRF